MKRITIALFLLGSLFTSVKAQVLSDVNMTFNITESNDYSGPDFEIKGTVFNTTTQYNGTDVDLGDVVCVLDGTQTYYLYITNIQYQDVSYIELTVTDSTATLGYVPTGQAALFRISPYVIPTIPDGLRGDLASSIINDLRLKVENNFNNFKDVKYVTQSVEGSTYQANIYKMAIDTVGIDTIYISNNNTFKRFESGKTYSSGFGINLLGVAGTQIEVDTNEIATQYDLTAIPTGIDTFRVASNNVELSLENDNEPKKTIPVISIAPVQSVVAGTGITVTPLGGVYTVNNTGDLSTTNEIQQIDTFQVNGANLILSLQGDGQPAKSVAASSIVTAGGAATGVGVLNRVPIYSSPTTFTTQPYYAITYSDADAISQSIGSYSYYGQIPAYVAPYMGQNARVIDATGAVKVQNPGLAPSLLVLSDGGGLSYYASPTNLAANTNIFTNSYLKWKVEKTGNMAVGVVTPTARVHIAGADNLTTNYALKVQGATDNNALVVRNDGKIGIGTNMTTANNYGQFNINGRFTAETEFLIDRADGLTSAYLTCTVREAGATGALGTGLLGQAELYTYGTGGFAIGTGPGAVVSPFVISTNGIERIRVAATGPITLKDYPSTLNTAGNPVNVLSTSSTGIVESHPISEVISAAGAPTGSGANGRITYWTGASTQSGSDNLFWSGTNLGIGTNTPGSRLHTIGGGEQYWKLETTSTGYSGILFKNGTQVENRLYFNANSGVDGTFVLGSIGGGGGTNKKLAVAGGVSIGYGYASTNIPQANSLIVEGNVGFGTNDPQRKVHISGTNPLQIDVVGYSSNILIQSTSPSVNGGLGIAFKDASDGITKHIYYKYGTFMFGSTGAGYNTDGNKSAHFHGGVSIGSGLTSEYNTNGLISEGSVSIGSALTPSKLFIKGTGTTSSTSSLIITNSNGNPLVYNLKIDDNGAIGFGQYPNTLNSTGSPVNILSTSSTGVLESHTASELVSAGGGVSGTLVANRIPYTTGTGTITTSDRIKYNPTGSPDGHLVVRNGGYGDWYAALEVINTATNSAGTAFIVKDSITNVNVFTVSGVKTTIKNELVYENAVFNWGGGSSGEPIKRMRSIGDRVVFTDAAWTGRVELNPTTGALGLNTVSTGAMLNVKGSGSSSTTWTAQFHNNATNNALMIRDDGNIGIGTASPSYKAHLYNTTNIADGIYTENTNSGTAAQSIVTAKVAGGPLITMGIPGGGFTNTGLMNGYRGYIRSTGSSGMLIASDNPTGAIVLATEGTATTNERLRIDGGQVKSTVNFYAPSSTAFRGGGGGTGVGMSFWGTEDSGTGWGGFMGRNMKYDGTNYKYISTNASNLWGTVSGLWVEGHSAIAMRFLARPATEEGTELISTATDRNNYTRMVITYAGNVGVGTLTPAQTLHVQGTARITGSDGVATTIMGRDGDGDISVLGLGSGLSITSGVLNVSASGATNLAVSGTSSPLTLTSDTGTDVTFTAGTGMSLTGTSGNITITNTGDTNAADDLTTSTLFDGEIEGTYDNLFIKVNTVTSDHIVDGNVTMAKIANAGATSGQIISWNGTAWTPSNIGYGASTDVIGTASSLTVTKIQNRGIATTAPTSGQVLAWTGSLWAPTTISSGGITSLNGQTGATQTFFASSTGSDFAITSSGNVHTFVLPTANATQTGKLTSSDWATFSNKIGGSGTTDQLAIFTGSGTISSSSALSYASSTLTVAGDISPTGKLKAGTLGTTPTVIVGRNASNEISTVSLGTGLSLTSGTLTASNLYTADGTLSGYRTITFGNNSLQFNSTGASVNGAEQLVYFTKSTGSNFQYPISIYDETATQKFVLKVASTAVTLRTNTEDLKLGTSTKEWSMTNAGLLQFPGLASNPTSTANSMWFNTTTNRLMLKTNDGNVKTVATLQDDLAGTNLEFSTSQSIGGTNYGNEVTNTLTADITITLGASLTEGREYKVFNSNDGSTWDTFWTVASGYTVKLKDVGNVTSADGLLAMSPYRLFIITRYGNTIYVSY